MLAISVLALLLASVAIYVERTRQGAKPTEDTRSAQGLAIRLGTVVAIGMLVSELGGNHEAIYYFIVVGAAGGSILGFILDRPPRRRDA